MSKGPKKRKKYIRAPEAVVVNECEGFWRGRGGLLSTPRRLVVLHLRARPEGFLLMGEGLWGSTGASSPRRWLGLTEAGRIVMLVALGVAMTRAYWIEWVGLGGGVRHSRRRWPCPSCHQRAAEQGPRQ